MAVSPHRFTERRSRPAEPAARPDPHDRVEYGTDARSVLEGDAAGDDARTASTPVERVDGTMLSTQGVH